MAKFIAVFTSIISMFMMVFTDVGGSDYVKLTSVKDTAYMLFNKKAVCEEYHTGEPSAEVFTGEEEYSLDDTAVLIKEKNKDFKIINLTDIHFSDYGYRMFLNPEHELLMRRIIEAEKPDLIMLTGDMVCGDESDYYSIRRITDMLESYGIPWAPVFGNHDDESNCDLNYLADVMMSSPHCLMKKGDPEMGVGNYIVNIAEKNEDGSLNVVSSLLFMDSHHSQPNEKQQKWVKWACDGINGLTDKTAEISVIMHIPLPEYQYAYDLYYDSAAKKWKEGSEGYGELHEKICCERDADGEPVQRGFFDVLKNAGMVKHVICGHEHMNDFSVKYDGIRLTYCMKLGRSSGYQPGFNGASVFTVDSEGIAKIEHKSIIAGVTCTLETITR